MTTNVSLTQALLAAANDPSISEDDMKAILRTAEEDGKVTDGERHVIEAFVDAYGAKLTDGARRRAHDFMARYSKADSPIEIDEDEALESIAKDFSKIDSNGDGKVTEDELKKFSERADLAPRMKAAVRQVMMRFARYKGSDDAIGPAELERALLAARMTPERTLDAFEKYLAAGHAEIRLDELETIAGDPKAPDELRAAARYALDHTKDFTDELKQASGKPPPYEGINLEDVRAFRAFIGPPAKAPAGPDAVADKAPPHDDVPVKPETQSEIDQILNDPTMTIEDQVAAILMLVMKDLDKQIEAQMKHVDDLQKQKKSATGDKKKDLDSSIDTETLKLKRLVDKRGQMFDMLRQIIDKYNQTAKAIIDTVGR